MKVGLAQYKFINNHISYNLSQVEKALKEAAGQVDLLCFGESFLQGFDALCGAYEKDREVALTQEAPEMQQLCTWSRKYGVALLVGYFERSEENLYSSCALISEGQIRHNYRRMSPGWKETSWGDHHYKEGEEVLTFSFKGQNFGVALCGDLWDLGWERFRTDHVLLWPVYVSFDLEQWVTEEQEYARQAGQVAHRVLMINSLCEEPASHGGAFDFQEGKIIDKLPYDQERVLVVEV